MDALPWLELDNFRFPSLSAALSEPNGLLAAGGDLCAERLIQAYRKGIFPWFDETQPILWWSPNPRAVLFPRDLKVSRSLKKRLRRGDYQVSCDRRFSDVVGLCADTPREDQHGTWITTEMHGAYNDLHNMGIAHSVETWFQGELVGGLYGLAIGNVFFGESMFSLKTDASKVAFTLLVSQLESWGYALIDCQVSSPHLTSLGTKEIPREEFSQLLAENIDGPGHSCWKDFPSII